LALTALIVSIVAALGVIGSVLVALWQGKTNKSAIEREAENSAARLELLRAQVQGEQQERQQQQQAYVSVEQGPRSGGEHFDGYQFLV